MTPSAGCSKKRGKRDGRQVMRLYREREWEWEWKREERKGGWKEDMQFMQNSKRQKTGGQADRQTSEDKMGKPTPK